MPILIHKEWYKSPEPAIEAYINELKKENRELEEKYQKAIGEINADPLYGECKDKSEILDDFICSHCGIHLVSLTKIIKEQYDDGFTDDECYIYEPKFCPECGRKIIR